MGWLEELIEVAVEEARERGHRVVEAHHLALALTRDAATAELLAELGKNPRVWRDYINFILGLNVGMDAGRREQVHAGHLVSADELYAQDAPPIHDRVQAILAQVRAETGDERPIGPAELLSAIFTSGAGGIAAGTARWLGLTAAAVREAAGLSTAPRPLLEDVDPATLPRPDPRGPLVLLGGGPTPPEALQAAVDLADLDGEAQVAWVNAADPWLPRLVGIRQQQFDQATPGTKVVDIGLRDRSAAHDPQVVAALEQADIVFLDGGSSERLYRALAGTPALDALVALSQRGGVVMGYSAGTELLGAGTLTGWMTWGERDEPHPLLAWLPDTVIYPHASGERELERFRATVAAFPGCNGLGIAHGGAAFIPAASQTPTTITHGWDDGCVTLATADDVPVPLKEAPDFPNGMPFQADIPRAPEPREATSMSRESWSEIGPWREPADLVQHGFLQSRVVIMNEAHDGLKRCVRTRVVGRFILPAAHEAGVRDLALEALFPHWFVSSANRLRRVPPKDEGYLSQPDMRAFIQAALDLGWTLWPYEADFEKRPAEFGDDTLSMDYTNWREREQAKNLARVLQQLPDSAPLLVWCGNGHGSKLAYGGEWTPMGWHLIREAQLDPFVIDQAVSVFGPQVVEPLRPTLEALGGTAGLLRQDAGPLSHRHDVDAFIFSLDNELR